jgi:hypothetical protein
LNESWRERQPRRLLILAAVMLLWALVVGLTGGFVLSIGGLRLSSRSMRNALIGFTLCVAGAWLSAPPGKRWHTVADTWARLTAPVDAAVASWNPLVLRRIAESLAIAAAIAVTVIGITKGSLVAGGSDSYGYVSQAHLWATGTLRVQPPFDGDGPEGLSNDAFTPLGYRLSPDGRSLVPTYASGFPMVMAVFERVAGPDAVFYAMPILAGVTVWATYLLGVIVGGPAVGLLAAALMAMSPTFLFQLTHAPMSDIAAACWWTLALVILPRTSRLSAFLMGACAGVAILTRPNLVPLAIVPAAWLVWSVAKNRTRGLVMARLVLYAIGPVVASLFIAGLNRYWYGSPTSSGYGALAGELFRWDFLWPNVVNYSRSLLTTQTLAIVTAIGGPLLVTSSIVTPYVLFVVMTYLCYAVYLPMEAWWGLRFFLPAFPIVFVLLSVVIIRGPARLSLAPRVLWPILIAILIFSHIRMFVRDMGVLDSTGERRFAQIGRYIADTLPPRAILFAVLHSGSAMYYSGRPTIRFDALPPGRLRAIANEFRRRGYAPFIVLDTFEREDFANRFGPAADLGTLDARAAKLIPNVELYQVH